MAYGEDWTCGVQSSEARKPYEKRAPNVKKKEYTISSHIHLSEERLTVIKTKKKPSRDHTAEEIEFFDGHYLQSDHTVINWFKKWLVSLAPEMPNPKECTDKLLVVLGTVKGKDVCDLGCGEGILTRELAIRGARVSAVDISMEAVRITRERCREFIEQVDVRQMDVCNLLYGDESFDIVTGNAILHHVDIAKAASEISRVLKPGGKGIFSEPLAHNPISNIWRKLTPDIRSPNEWPLSYSEIAEMSKHFSSVNYEEFDLLPLLSSLVYLITFSHKAKERSAELLARLEHPFLKLCKPLRRYSGAVLIEFTK